MTNKHWQFINRYGDNDKHWWRFRYSPASSGWTPTGIMLETSGGGYDESGRAFNILSVMLRGRTLQLILPEIVKPYIRTKFYTPDGADEPRTYTETFRREFGFRAGDGAIHFHYGEQVMEWPGDKSKVWFYPWRETTHIRHSIYDEAGELFATFTDDKMWGDSYEARKAIEAACPVKLFLFAENDGDLRVAQCRIEEREWRRGRGLWRWLLAWKPNMVRRSLAIEYSSEVGRRKGSWKGGTIGTGIDMEKGELPIEAFTRHCKKEGLHFIADVTELKKTDLCQDLTFAQIGKAISSLGLFWPDMCKLVTRIYRAGLVPVFDKEKAVMKAWPAGPVNAVRKGDVIDMPQDEGHAPFEPGTVAAMMADGGVEGQWGSPMVIRQVSDEEFRRMVEGAAADGTVNAAMHEEFEARGLDTAQIPVVDPTADARALHEYWRSRDDLIMPPPVQDAGPLESTAMAGCDTGRNSFGVMAEIEGFEKSSDHEK